MIITNFASAQLAKCDCQLVYRDLIEKLEDNYIGLKHVKALNQYTTYEKRKIEFAEIATNTNSSNCTKILQQFLNYFEDGHLFVYESPKYSEEETEQLRNTIKSNKVSISSILKIVEIEKDWKEKNGLDGIIGKWTDGESNFAIVKDEGFYKAYIINSQLNTVEPGELKAQFVSASKGFEGTYYTNEYSPKFVEGNIYKDGTLLVFTGAKYWKKVVEFPTTNEKDITLPVIQKLDTQNTLISIPSFMVDYQKFNQILFENIDLLKNTTNLIIDIRGNVGGNGIYFALINAYFTQSLPSTQGLALSSEQTKIYFEKLAKNSPGIYGPVVERIKANSGAIVDGPAYPSFTFEPFESKIQNVAILTDKGSMSAAESFIIHSKQASSKVKTFGAPTGGVIDYTSVNTLKLNSGDQNIYFGYPTSTLHKNIPKEGYNKTGIIPDVPIKDKVNDKIQFIVNYYKN